MVRFEDFDFSINREIAEIREEGQIVCTISIEDGEIHTSGQLGYNYYSNWLEFLANNCFSTADLFFLV